MNEWTEKQKMAIFEKKTNAMIFNYTDNYQFTTQLELKGQNIEMVEQMKVQFWSQYRGDGSPLTQVGADAVMSGVT